MEDEEEAEEGYMNDDDEDPSDEHSDEDEMDMEEDEVDMEDEEEMEDEGVDESDIIEIDGVKYAPVVSEEEDEDRELEQVARWLQLSPKDVDGVRQRLEGVEADADGQQHLQGRQVHGRSAGGERAGAAAWDPSPRGYSPARRTPRPASPGWDASPLTA